MLVCNFFDTLKLPKVTKDNLPLSLGVQLPQVETKTQTDIKQLNSLVMKRKKEKKLVRKNVRYKSGPFKHEKSHTKTCGK